MPSATFAPTSRPACPVSAHQHLVRASVAAVMFILARPATAHAQQPLSLTLGGAARIAADRGTQTEAARARSAQADARAVQRRSALLPSLSTSTQYSARTFNTASLGLNMPTPSGEPAFDTRGEVLGPVRSTDLRTQLSQRVLDLPALYGWRAAGADAEAVRFGVNQASEEAAERGALAYLAVVRAEARIAARSADSALAAELVDIARQQVQAGVGIALDVTRAQAHLADARARLIATRSDRDRGLLQLKHELALAAEAPITIADSLADPGSEEFDEDPSGLLQAALARRADFLEAQALSVSASTQMRAARAERYPVISLFADQGRNGKDVDRLLDTYSYGIQVSAPLFDGFRASSRSAEQKGRQREAEARMADTRRQVETDVRSALLTLRATREEVAAAQARLTLAEQEVAQARELFKAGISGNSDVINASIGLNGARDLVIDALARYHQSRVALANAQGTTTQIR